MDVEVEGAAVRVLRTMMNWGVQPMMPVTGLLLSRYRRFARDNRGQAAVEFAIVALPFFILLTAALDFGLMFFATSTLDNGINQSARRIRTGEVTANGVTEAQFRQMVCDEINMLLDCDERLAIDVRVFQSFNDIDFPAALDGNGNLTGNFQFNPGTAGDIVLVRIFYAWPMLTPVFGEALENMSGGSRLLSTSVAFRNEPFGALLP
ncbi:MAG TPA: pilus assembly protein [Alphaproteobacteria bacterium]|nr:pilus assembly protein [Alphaproteobacteria bacterium]